MLRKILLGAAASLTALVALPVAAQAQGYYDDGYYGRGYYDRGYYGDGYYDRGYYRDGYRRYRRGDYYGRGRYDDRRYYSRNRYRCGDGTTGAIVGGAAGALIGRSIDRNDRRGRYGRYRDSGAGGAIVGGLIGALVGREIDRDC